MANSLIRPAGRFRFPQVPKDDGLASGWLLLPVVLSAAQWRPAASAHYTARYLPWPPPLSHRPGIAYTCARTRAMSRGSPEEKVLPPSLRLTVSRLLCERGTAVDRGTELLIWAAASFRGKEGVHYSTFRSEMRLRRERGKDGGRETEREDR